MQNLLRVRVSHGLLRRTALFKNRITLDKVSVLIWVSKEPATNSKMALLQNFSQKWNEIMYSDADPRTRDMPLMGSPLPVITICIFYAIHIKMILLKVMDSRKAFNTRLLSLSLNIYLFCVSLYFLYKSSLLAWFDNYNWRCEPIDKSNSEQALEVRERN